MLKLLSSGTSQNEENGGKNYIIKISLTNFLMNGFYHFDYNLSNLQFEIYLIVNDLGNVLTQTASSVLGNSNIFIHTNRVIVINLGLIEHKL